MDLAGKRVTILGLGRHGGGVAAARYAVTQGAEVTIVDAAAPDELQASLTALADLPICGYRLGGQDAADVRCAEVLVVNPAVPPRSNIIAAARCAGATITSEIELFLDRCPAVVVGVTGSNGKSTTAAMTAAIFTAAGRQTWLGGNIGRSLLPDLGQITAHDVVVLELSSFQLAHLSDHAPLPQMAVVTGCTPNHLDWHGSLDAYQAAKRRLITGLRPDATVVLNHDDATVRGWACRLNVAPASPFPTAWLPKLKVPGAHNRGNAGLAATMAWALGCRRQDVTCGLASFEGLPHRLQPLAERDARLFVDDSAATTPESTISALAAMERPVWLLAGGRSKGCDWGPLGAAIARYARGATFFGESAAAITATATAHGARQVACAATLAEALASCWTRSETGDAILLSPACSSLDQFRDYADRAAEFGRLVDRLPAPPGRFQRAGLLI